MSDEFWGGKNNHPVLLYILDSTVISSEHAGKSPHSIHHNIIVPTLTELKGYMKFYIYDCAHPKIKEYRKTKHPDYEAFFKSVCDKKNKERQQTMVIYK